MDAKKPSRWRMLCRGPSRAGATRGFTLVELVSVIVLGAIMVSLAAPYFAAFVASQRVSNAATDLYMALTMARSEATKRGTSVTLAPGTGGWTNGWTIADPAIGGRDVLSHGPLTGLAMTGPDSVVYKLSGRVQGTAPSFTLSMSAGGTTAKRCVQTDLSGRPYVKTC